MGGGSPETPLPLASSRGGLGAALHPGPGANSSSKMLVGTFGEFQLLSPTPGAAFCQSYASTFRDIPSHGCALGPQLDKHSLRPGAFSLGTTRPHTHGRPVEVLTARLLPAWLLASHGTVRGRCTGARGARSALGQLATQPGPERPLAEGWWVRGLVLQDACEEGEIRQERALTRPSWAPNPAVCHPSRVCAVPFLCSGGLGGAPLSGCNSTLSLVSTFRP